MAFQDLKGAYKKYGDRFFSRSVALLQVLKRKEEHLDFG